MALDCILFVARGYKFPIQTCFHSRLAIWLVDTEQCRQFIEYDLADGIENGI